MYHKVIVVGNLGRDPEMRFTAGGKGVTNFSVATTEQWKGADGENRKKTVWWHVSAWGKQAETCNEYLKKGSKVLVEGRINADANGNPRTFQVSDGSTKASYEITADVVKFLSPKEEGSKPQQEEQQEEIPF